MSSKPEQRGPASPFIITTVPRSGTHWLAALLKGCGLSGRTRSRASLTCEEFHQEFIEALPTLPDRFFWYEHFHFSDLESALRSHPIKSLLLVRDPRDQMVSTYWYWYHKDKVVDGSFADTFERLLRNSLGQHLNIAVPWMDHAEPLLVRYEDLLSDPIASLTRILDFVGHPVPEEIAEVVDENGFSRLSGGRKVGEERTDHHYRKGVAGDWRNYFTPPLLEKYFSEFQEIHERLGYSLDDPSELTTESSLPVE